MLFAPLLANADDKVLRIISWADYVPPDVIAEFRKQTGIQVKVRNDDGIVLADQILQEGSRSPADVYLTENSPELMLLTQHHLLAPLPASITGQIPAQYNSPTGNWVGISVRVSALAYNPAMISSGQRSSTSA